MKCSLSNNLFYKFKLVLLWYKSRIETVLFSFVFIKCVKGRLQWRLKQTGRACFDQRAFIVKRITFFYLFLFVLFCFFTLLTFLISCEFKHACIWGFFPPPSLYLFVCFFVFLSSFLVSFLFLQFVFSFLVRSNKGLQKFVNTIPALRSLVF